MQQSVHALWQGLKWLMAASAVCYIFLLFCVLFFHLTGAFYQSILSMLLFMGIYVILGISFEHVEHVLMRVVRKCRSKKCSIVFYAISIHLLFIWGAVYLSDELVGGILLSTSEEIHFALSLWLFHFLFDYATFSFEKEA
ncbi:regulatory YrvL family protein [Bacillus safensis]|uniref:regulatory YrvL family protein n=1 Tax=Bacillus safensis TaxID=561879 RepID=UPI002E2D7F4A|nr:regulatory YrvL family protein [Bacillus safensis]MED5224658.1 regulatory YrvL family protein [Bacillus safensis]